MAPTVFTKYRVSRKTHIIGTFVFLMIGLLFGFLIGVKMYHNPGFEENIRVLKTMIKSRKKSIKGKES